jgi:hypothetical protein
MSHIPKERDDHPLVSVIITAHDREKYIAQAIESVLSQIYQQVELIVVDDGSTDGTGAIIASYGSRLVCLHNPIACGVSAARNRGIAAAGGKYIAFLDDDDFYLPERLEKQVALLASHPEARAVYSAVQYVDETGKADVYVEQGLDGNLITSLLVLKFSIYVSSLLAEKSCFEEWGAFTSERELGAMIEDLDMYLRWSMAGARFMCVHEPLACIRKHANNSMQSVKKWERATTALFERFFANPNLPADIAALKDKSLVSVPCCAATNCYRWNDAAAGDSYLQQALSMTDTMHDVDAIIAGALADVALTVHKDDPIGFVHGHMQKAPATKASRRIERHALGIVHYALAVDALALHARSSTLEHILGTLWHRPRMISNRGVISTAVHAVLPS